MENPVTLACGTARHAGEKKIPQALESTMQLWLCFDEAGSLADEIKSSWGDVTLKYQEAAWVHPTPLLS